MSVSRDINPCIPKVNLISVPDSHERLMQKLESWRESQLNQIDASQAVKLFLDLISGQTNELSLAKLAITSLPDIFHEEIIRDNLYDLDLWGVQIEALPENFDLPNLAIFDLSETQIESFPKVFNLPNLKQFFLSETPITSLPEDFSSETLEVLNLSGTPITSFSESFKFPSLKDLDLSGTQMESLSGVFNLSSLQKLNLSEIQIESLPEILDFPNLKILNLSETRITRLPENFNFPILDKLDLSGAPISSLPENFNPTNLKQLDLSRTLLTSLPQRLNLPNLAALDLSNTQITSLPETIFNLPQSSIIFLTMSNFSSRLQDILRERISEPNYAGPNFYFSMRHSLKPDLSNVSLDVLLKRVFEKAAVKKSPGEWADFIKNLTQNQSPSDVENCKLWLFRLFEVADANSQNNRSYFKSVIKFLDQVSRDKELKDLFYGTVEEACTTCGDRIALSLLHFDLHRQLVQADISRPQEVYSLLRNGVFILSLLEECASNIVPTLRLVDPLEVYLALPVKLKEEYNIPIALDEMLYFCCSSLTERHLQDVRNILNENLNDENKVHEFLIQQDKWKKVLSTLYPQDMEKINNGLENIAGLEDVSSIDAKRKDITDKLIELSKKAPRIRRYSLRVARKRFPNLIKV